MDDKKFLQNISILGGGQFVVIILGLVFYFGLAYFLGPEKYGNLAYFVSFAVVLPAFTRFGLSLAIITFGAKNERTK